MKNTGIAAVIILSKDAYRPISPWANVKIKRQASASAELGFFLLEEVS